MGDLDFSLTWKVGNVLTCLGLHFLTILNTFQAVSDFFLVSSRDWHLIPWLDSLDLLLNVIEFAFWITSFGKLIHQLNQFLFLLKAVAFLSRLLLLSRCLHRNRDTNIKCLIFLNVHSKSIFFSLGGSKNSRRQNSSLDGVVVDAAKTFLPNIREKIPRPNPALKVSLARHITRWLGSWRMRNGIRVNKIINSNWIESSKAGSWKRKRLRRRSRWYADLVGNTKPTGLGNRDG